ncbi:M15 family metallopeptidase [Saccharopolyspora sp. K220]|uniref:M15 family metallopeptidase n=1 Tax=Saccharopolyspora soli TaxID=2926618 RepID=UPI001F5754BB|nr:M15 family metallopeptidase [Saccharopolyspora soli]MCI2416099.1 M15 family metallopeptidase [Saccharopolyspora soli]
MRTRRDPPFARRRSVGVLAGTIAVGLALVQCAPAEPPRTPAEPPRVSAESPPQFSATVHPVTAAELGATWHPGCPVEPSQLRRVELSHIGFDGRTHLGQLVVNQDRVPQVIDAFEQLYRIRYPIEKIRTVDHYPGAEDELSMEDNNTSAFNCRDIPGRGKWSYHAYGRAVDINPLINPYLDNTGPVQPKNAAMFLDRTRSDPGMLHDGDPAVRAFTDRGWRWGGRWTSPIDYQHFELP